MNKFIDLSKFDTDILSEKFNNSSPFQHIVIDNFLNEETADQVLHDLENDNFDKWDKRDQ